MEPTEPKNLKALLNFCLKADDGKNLTTIDPKEADEKSKWLNKVLNEISVNIGQRMIDNINILLDVIESKEVTDDSQAAIEELQDITENLDYAKDFIKLNGLKIIKELIQLDLGTLTLKTCSLLANVTQNDEFCQTSAVAAGLVQLILQKVACSSDGLYVKKMIYGLSCCVRGSKKGRQTFLENEGIQVVIDAIQKSNKDSHEKCLFFLYCLSRDCEGPLLSEVEFSTMLDLLCTCDLEDPALEHLSHLVLTEMEKRPQLRSSIDAASAGALRSQVDKTRGKPEYQETHEYLRGIIERL